MSYDDRKHSHWQSWESDDESMARPAVSPGKRTLTMRLLPRLDAPEGERAQASAGASIRSASSSAFAQAPVQRKVAPAAVVQRDEQAARPEQRTEQWTGVAIRPDLHDAPVQRKSTERASDQVSPEPPAGGGQPLPEDVQAKMEGAFGTDFSAVRVHEGQHAEAMGALAYTQGTDIHFAPGQYNPGSQRGQTLLGHELTHVVQQSQGRVRATTQAKGMGVNDDAGLEAEADELGARAAQGENVHGGSDRAATGPGGASPRAGAGIQFSVDPDLQSQGSEDGDKDGVDNAKGGPRAGAPRTKAQALARHKKNQNLMKKIIASGLSLQPDPTLGAKSRMNLFKNSAEWIDKGEAQMFVLSPTHDSEKRDSIDASETAYFDTRVDYKGSGATYDDTLTGGKATNDAGIKGEISSVVGTMSGDGKTLTMIDPQKNSEGFVVETLIHEVQHDADQHKKGDPWAVVPGPSASPEPAGASFYNSYQSEFRAYWMENAEGTPKDKMGSSTNPAKGSYTIKAIRSWGADKAQGGGDDTVDTATLTPSNERQENILLHMGMTTRPAGDWYDYTPGATRWNTSYGYVFYYYAVDPAFKAMVDAYTKPVSGNLINSVRIQKLSEAIAAVDWSKIISAITNLDPLDLEYLSDRAASKPLWDQASSKLGLFGYGVFEAMITNPPMGPYQNTYTTVKGDTLSGIADRLLYDMNRWQEIYAMNKSTIGSDPNKLKIGLKLVLPPQ